MPNETLKTIQKMTQEDMRRRILAEILSDVQKPDLSELAEYLSESDFFTAPAARFHHHADEGGLARHTLEVYELAMHMAQAYPSVIKDHIAIAAICHDLCKIDYYVKSKDPASDAQIGYVESLFRKTDRQLPRGYKDNKAFCSSLIEWCKNGCPGDIPVEGPQWEIQDKFPLGHGEKSLYIASQFIDLDPEEALAIRWHADYWEVSKMNEKSYNLAREMTPLVILIAHADMQSAILWGR